MLARRLRRSSGLRSLLFDGSNDYVDLGKLGNVGGQLNQDFDIEFGVKFTGGTIMGTVNDGTSTYIYVRSHLDGICLEMRASNGTYYLDCYSDTVVVDGIYHDIKVQKRGNSTGDVTFVIDGNTASTISVRNNYSGNSTNFQYPLLLGARNYRGVYDRFTLMELYYFKFETVTDGGNWPINEGSGNTIYDQSGNNYHGAIEGAIWG